MSDERVPAAARRSAGRWLVVALFVAGAVAFVALGGPRYLDLEVIRGQRETLRAYAAAHPLASLAAGFAIYVAVVALSVPGAAVLSLLAGFVYGRWVGTALVVVAATVGATLVFLAARYLVGDWARRRAGPTAARIREGFAANAFPYLLFLRLVPAFPFFLVNLAAALTAVALRTYVLATLIGIVPGTFVYVNLGQALGSIDSVRGLLSAQSLMALALLAALSLLPVAWKRLRRPRS